MRGREGERMDGGGWTVGGGGRKGGGRREGGGKKEGWEEGWKE